MILARCLQLLCLSSHLNQGDAVPERNFPWLICMRLLLPPGTLLTEIYVLDSCPTEIVDVNCVVMLR